MTNGMKTSEFWLSLAVLAAATFLLFFGHISDARLCTQTLGCTDTAQPAQKGPLTCAD